jgi:fructose-1-phosphate kinase PfkB-like protein
MCKHHHHLLCDVEKHPLTCLLCSTIGAGDTFIAGILFAYAATPTFSWWYTYSSEAMDFAIELAGRKVTQEGFQGLGEAMQVDDQIEHLLRNCKLSTS